MSALISTNLQPTTPRWGISTLGDGAASLADWMAFCAARGISEIELRVLSGSLDIATTLSRFFDSPAQFSKVLSGQPAQITVLSASLRLAIDHSEHRAELLALVPWAEAAGIPWLRVFDKCGPHLPWSDAEWKTAARQFRWWREERQKNGWKTDLIIEGHNAFFRPEDYRRFCEMVEEKPRLIFDIGHAVHDLGPEKALAAWEALAPFCPRVHFKDGLSPDGAAHCLPGKGIVPLKRFFQLFRESHPRPVLTFEWERWWHPSLPPLDQAWDELQSQLVSAA